jgi:signal transduction histidine kinase
LRVSDTGTGIEENDLKDLFSVFTKIMKNRSLNKEGCGLGLTISRNIAAALNGDLKVFSKVGEGSVFTLVLPYDRSRENLS